ncbi:MAG: hypothetical protein ACRDGI_02050 [Candidatus Limnocylindrales bacterium]
MRRLATFAWHTPAPTAVDEELAIFDDGSAWLVVRGPRVNEASIGTYRVEPVAADQRTLAAAGPGPLDFDLLHPPSDGPEAAVMAVADRVAAAARAVPDAVATFHVRELERRGAGPLAIALQVVASGTRPVEFRLDPPASSVLFGRDCQTLGWSDLPRLASGFVTADAVELGGVRQTARIEPGEYGAIAFDLPAPAGASAVSVRVAGWLTSVPPDEPAPGRFGAATDEAPLRA